MSKKKKFIILLAVGIAVLWIYYYPNKSYGQHLNNTPKKISKPLPGEALTDIPPRNSPQLPIKILNRENDNYDPLYTMHVLNYFIGSLINVIDAHDRIVLDQEYQNIICNLKLSNIKADPEIVALFQEFMDMISLKQLNSEERQRFIKAYNKRRYGALWQAIGGIRAYGADVKTFILSLAQNAISSFFNYQNLKEELEEDLDKSLWQLRKDEVWELNEVRKGFIEAAWKLQRKYNLPDKLRLDERLFKDYLAAIHDRNYDRALRKLDRIKEYFNTYPPFWFHYGIIAQKKGDSTLALNCFDTFEKNYRSILRRDPYYAQMCIAKAGILLSLGIKDDVPRLLNIARKNSPPSGGWNYFVMAVMYTELGNLKEAKECLQINIDNDVDPYIALEALHNIEQGRPINYMIPLLVALRIGTSSNPDVLNTIKLNDLKKLAYQNIPEAQYALFLLSNNKRQPMKDIKWLKIAAMTGYTKAVLQYLWNSFANDSEQNAIDQKLAVVFLKKAAKVNEEIKAYLALFYCTGRYVEKNSSKAEILFNTARMRKKSLWIIVKYALNNEWCDKANVLLCPSPNEDEVKNIRKYAKLPNDELVLFAWDDTWLNSFKKGFCLTRSHAYSSSLEKCGSIRLSSVNEVTNQDETISLDNQNFYKCPDDIECEQVVNMIRDLVSIAKENP